MKEFFQMVKTWDIILIVLLILLSFLPFGIFTYQQAAQAGNDSTLVAVITVDNQETRRVPLTGNTETEVFDIVVSEHEKNTVEVDHEHIRIKSATCSDQVCVRTGAISKPGETIVCLPHKIVIEIQSTTNEPTDEEIIISS
ncbi:NusG domain II-containing protein [Oceanobacillus halophilus]|uniref:NusG domain II-containing protein n=1 Tax=Oceanobacillus halophilus TaxID=930130 RepID=A0A495A6G9_9BACI|nr:NusG domain II-containing protein [Oceanobacillus halophilus]RKQ33931.1 NusG domain II-containing protein [Oceanobacillus halophilus]